MKHGKAFISVGIGGFIVNDQNQLLLLKRKTPPEAGCWNIPGGRVEFGETLEEAVVREVEEETSLKVKPTSILGIVDHIVKNENVHWIATHFLCTIIEGQPKITEPEKHESIEWFSFENLPEKQTITLKQAIQEYKALNKTPNL